MEATTNFRVTQWVELHLYGLNKLLLIWVKWELSALCMVQGIGMLLNLLVKEKSYMQGKCFNVKTDHSHELASCRSGGNGMKRVLDKHLKNNLHGYREI